MKRAIIKNFSNSFWAWMIAECNWSSFYYKRFYQNRILCFINFALFQFRLVKNNEIIQIQVFSETTFESLSLELFLREFLYFFIEVESEFYLMIVKIHDYWSQSHFYTDQTFNRIQTVWRNLIFYRYANAKWRLIFVIFFNLKEFSCVILNLRE